jgi:antitoxin component of RelBE/YafQ-DinJ toxin-antitoxin module
MSIPRSDQFSTRVDRSVREAAHRRARKDRITVSALVRGILRYYAGGGVLPRQMLDMVREETVPIGEETAVMKPPTVVKG